MTTTKRVTVLHLEVEGDQWGKALRSDTLLFTAADYVAVGTATITADDDADDELVLSGAYTLTQNTSYPWRPRGIAQGWLTAAETRAHPCRSTSIGDVIRIDDDGSYWRVNTVGFARIDAPDVVAAMNKTHPVVGVSVSP